MTGLLNARRERRIADAVIRDPEEHTVMDERGAVRSIQAADVTRPGRRARGALERDPPRAPGAHVLEVPLARDARADPRHLHRHRAARGAAVPAVRAAALRRPRVRGHARQRRRALAHHRRPAGLQARAPRRRLPRDRRAPLPGRGGGLGDRPRRGRGRELLPRDRDLADEVRLLAHAVEDPRARHPRLPALARAPRARASPPSGASTRAGSARRRTARSPSATRRGGSSRRSPRRRSPASSRSPSGCGDRTTSSPSCSPSATAASRGRDCT